MTGRQLRQKKRIEENKQANEEKNEQITASRHGNREEIPAGSEYTITGRFGRVIRGRTS